MSNKVAPVPLYDALQQLKSETLKDLRVCLPGSISAVDPATGTVSVLIGVMQKLPQINLPEGLDTLYPQLTMCPVFTIQGGGVGAVMPVAVGDECLVVFSDRCIDAWYTNGQPMPLPSNRLHDISDGFVLVGLNSLRNPLLTPLLPFEGGICQTNDELGAKVVVNSETGLVSIKNAEQDLALILTNLATTLSAMIAPTDSVTSVLISVLSSVIAVNTAIALEAGTIPTAAAAAVAQNAILSALVSPLAASAAAAQTGLAETAAAVPGLLY